MRLMPNALGLMIQQALDEQQLSVREAASRCHLSLGRLADVLYGRTQRPRPDTLQAIAEGLNLSYRELALAAYGIVYGGEPVAVGA